MREAPSSRPIYMDHHATTPVDPRVLKAMLPFFSETFGNASSTDHEHGAAAFRVVQTAREQVARLIGSRPEEIIFTSGATEADNLAILGVAENYTARGNHIITVQTEHPAVLDPCKYLQARGWQITYLPVDSYGLIDPDDLRRAITSQTVLISVMTANNEIGTIAPITEIGKIAREHEVLFHTDATQMVGCLSVDVDAMNIDLLSLSAHKFYGPKGVGALYVRKSRPRVRVAPQQHGGGHERGMRSGTLNVPGIVGLGCAANIACREMEARAARLRELRDALWEGLQANIESIELNGSPLDGPRLPHNLNVALRGIESRSLIVQLKHDISLSTGSACATVKVEPSHVLLALGHDADRAHQSLRFGLGCRNTREEVIFSVERITAATQRLHRVAHTLR